MATRFLDIVAADRRAAWNRTLIAAILAVALVGAAWILGGWVGLGVHIATVMAGAGLGILLARRRSRTFEASMRHTWTQWMRFAVTGESVAEIHRKVRGVSGRNQPILYAALLLLVFASEATLLVIALLPNADPAPEVSVPFVAATGLFIGVVAGYAATMTSWYKGLGDSVGELLDAGEVGLWGVV